LVGLAASAARRLHVRLVRLGRRAQGADALPLVHGRARQPPLRHDRGHSPAVARAHATAGTRTFGVAAKRTALSTRSTPRDPGVSGGGSATWSCKSSSRRIDAKCSRYGSSSPV